MMCNTHTITLQVLTVKQAEDYAVIQHFEAKQLSVDLLDKPRDFYMHNRRYAASVIMQVTYGWRIPECTFPLLNLPQNSFLHKQ